CAIAKAQRPFSRRSISVPHRCHCTCARSSTSIAARQTSVSSRQLRRAWWQMSTPDVAHRCRTPRHPRASPVSARRRRTAIALSTAGEDFLGEIGNAIVSRPELFEGVDPRIARLFRWHGYEEVEHKAVLFDAFHAARGRGIYTYAVRIAGLWIAVVLVALALSSVSYRILASAGAAGNLRGRRSLVGFVLGRGGILRGRWRAV